MAKTHDLSVAVGVYTDRSGEQKKRWKTIGSIVETQGGGKVILIDATFNPAGVPREPGRDQIMISMFTPNEKTASPAAPAAAPADAFVDMNDDIPF